MTLGFEGMLGVNSQGWSEGLALFWKEEEQGKVLTYSQNHIDIETKVNGMEPWRLTGIYKEPNRTNRRKTWELLRNLARDSNLPWCTIGDMNNILAQSDKRGGNLYSSWLVEGFNEVVIDGELVDMKLIGHQYT